METILVSGANRGIGLEHVRRFAARNATVFACVRDPSDAADLNAIADQADGRVRILAYDAADPLAPDV